MKNKIIGTISLLLVVGLLTGCGCQNKKEKIKKEETKINTNENVIKDQKVGKLELTNTSLITKNGQSTLVTVVTNNTKEKVLVKSFDIYVKDKDKKLITTLLGYVGEEVPAGQSRTITSNVDRDLTQAYSVEYKINK